MAEQTEQILIEVKFDTSAVDGAKKALQENLNQLAANKKELAELNKNVQAGNALTEAGAKRYAQLNKDIEENKRAIKSNTAIIQAATSARATENDTLDMQRQYLNTLQKAFAGLTSEQKEAMGGQEELEKAIKAVSDSIKAQESAIGDNRRNVGNYAESIQQAFGEMAHAGELISPAVGLLRGMGGEGKKAAAALDALGKVMQLAGKAGKVFASAQQAQTTATEGATVAQNGLNTAMAANPIGLIVAGISTLLPLIQTFMDATSGAEEAQKAFNAELERQNTLLTTLQSDYDFAARLAAAEGKSQMEVLQIRREGAKKQLALADETYNALSAKRRNMTKKQKEATQEEFDQAVEAQKEAAANLNTLNEEIAIAETAARTKRKEENAKDAQERKDAAQKEADEYKTLVEGTLTWLESQMAESTAKFVAERDAKIQALKNANDKLLAGLDEEEENEDEPMSVEDMARKHFGLDDEGVEYYKSLLDQGVDAQTAASQAIDDQWNRNAKNIMQILHNIGDGFEGLGDILGEFSEQSEEAAKAQKAFTLIGILTNQAASIGEGALAIAKGVESAAGIPFPFNLPAIISITATIGGLISGVASTIAQAKQLFSQADSVGNFAQGGIVGGTSYTGDKLTAHVNSREMILPLDEQKVLFDALSSAADGNRTLGIDYELLAAANAALPAPVVVYKELQEFGDKVSTYQEIARV